MTPAINYLRDRFDGKPAPDNCPIKPRPAGTPQKTTYTLRVTTANARQRGRTRLTFSAQHAGGWSLRYATMVLAVGHHLA